MQSYFYFITNPLDRRAWQDSRLTKKPRKAKNDQPNTKSKLYFENSKPLAKRQKLKTERNEFLTYLRL
jgi:hypothetical protein